MEDCLFCKIGDGRIPVQAMYEDDRCIAFADINPQAPVHLLVIPREHFANAAASHDILLGHLLKVAATLGDRDLAEGYRIVTNTGANAGQTVAHLHLHLLGGRAMSWPPG